MSKSRQLSDAINSVDISESAPADAVTLDASGNLLVGKTAIGQGTAGFEARASGQTFCTDDGAAPLIINRLTSDGQIIQINKDGTTVGSITTRGGDVLVGTGDTAVRFDDANDAISPQNITTNTGRDAAIDLGISSGRFKDLYLSGGVKNVGGNNRTVSLLGTDAGGNHRGLVVGAGAVSVNADNAIDLGASGQRYKDLYLSGGVYLGGTGAANYLDDYEKGSWTPTYTDGSGGTYSSTYGNQAAQYIKIGKLVYINCEIIANNSLTSNGLTGGSELRVSGLPFPNDSVPQATGHIEANFDIPSGYTHTGFFIRNGGTSYVSFRYMGDNAAYSNVTVTMLEGATGSRYVVISGFYVTNS